MPKVPAFPITEDYLRATRRELQAAHPNADPTVIEYGLGQDVAVNVLGYEWYTEKALGEKQDAFYKPPNGPDLSIFVHQHRVILLAQAMLICQDLPGFVEQREVLANRSLLGVFHELNVARLLAVHGREVAFVVSTGERGKDFDLLVDGVLAVEAKAKDDTTSYSPGTLKNTLSEARSQLPPEGPGLIALRIPDAWGADLHIVLDAQQTIARAVAGSRRVNSVILVWDEWSAGQPDGASCTSRTAILQNSNPRTPFPNLGHLLGALSA